MSKSGAEWVDVLFTNGQVLTVDKDFTIMSALAIRGNRILAVGGPELAQHYRASRHIDLKGRTVMPGFDDTHIHIVAMPRRQIDFSTTSSIIALQSLISQKARELGQGEWVTGTDWDEAKFEEKRNPTRTDLDKAAPRNPVVLFRAGGHSSVSNSLALKAAGIDRNTPDPKSGLIEHDLGGEPNGIIRERSDIITRLVPSDSWNSVRGSYVSKLEALLPFGITSIMEASGRVDDRPDDPSLPGLSGDSINYVATYDRLRAIYDSRKQPLPRVTLYISYPGEEPLKAYPHHTGYGDAWVRLGPIGESPVDGGFTGPTAWTLADYKGQPGFRGVSVYTDPQLQRMTDVCAQLGWQVGLHAIGDAAIVQTVNAYSKSIEKYPASKEHRWFLDHFVVMPPAATMDTMVRDKIAISQQPNFLFSLEARYMQTLDDERISHIVSMASPRNHGIFIAFGSDNLPIGPLVGLYAAVSREGPSGHAWGKSESVSMQDAIRMYTAAGPYLTSEEAIKGSLEPGKLADLIVLDTDPLTNSPKSLLAANVDLTMIDGKIVFDRVAAHP